MFVSRRATLLPGVSVTGRRVGGTNFEINRLRELARRLGHHPVRRVHASWVLLSLKPRQALPVGLPSHASWPEGLTPLRHPRPQPSGATGTATNVPPGFLPDGAPHPNTRIETTLDPVIDACLKLPIIPLHAHELSKGKTVILDFGIGPKDIARTIAALTVRRIFGTAEREGVLARRRDLHERGRKPRRIVGVVVDDLIPSWSTLQRNKIGGQLISEPDLPGKKWAVRIRASPIVVP